MEERRPAIIFDIDGTLAHGIGRKQRWGSKIWPYQDQDAHDDTLDDKVAYFVDALSHEFDIIICSGRKDSSRDVLIKWLEDNDLHFDAIFMRKAKDNRKDSIVKRELYEEFIAPKWDVFVVFDDREQVVDMWRNELGLKVFQVADGSF